MLIVVPFGFRNADLPNGSQKGQRYVKLPGVS
jgi:hypothetical protein